MIETTEIFIPIPKTRNAQIKVEINGDDLTSRVVESSFTKPVTNGIGTFKVKLSNASGGLTGTYSSGNFVKFYADNSDATTRQFWGRIDNISEIVGDDGKFLEIEGRHRAYLLTESLICHSATSTESSQVLKDIIDKLDPSYGFTYSNVNTTETAINVEWNYKKFWDCVIEICNFSGYDCYVDDNLDFHFFEANSILNTNDAVVEGDNLINSDGWGINDYYEKTRVTVIGKGKEGLPIVYTAISPNEGDEIREVFVNDSSANTLNAVTNLAESKLSEITNQTPQATTKSFGLETISPGDNIWLLIPRQEIHGQYKIIEIRHKFGMKSGGWRTELTIEQGSEDISKIIEKISQKSDRIGSFDNINKLNYSWYFGFDADSGTHSNTEITGGVLKTDGSASGTWISSLKEIPNNISRCEIRASGQSIPGTIFYISSDNGITYSTISLNTLKTKSLPGKSLKVEVDINSADTQIYSLVLLYS